jgi:hypothetical protein
MKQTLSLVKGWNLVSGNIDRDSLLNGNIDMMWKYANNSWQAYANDRNTVNLLKTAGIDLIDEITIAHGLWANVSQSQTLVILDNNSTSSSDNIKQGWNFLGTDSDKSVENISCSQWEPASIWKYSNGTWKVYAPTMDYKLPTFDTVLSNEGFWLKCN